MTVAEDSRGARYFFESARALNGNSEVFRRFLAKAKAEAEEEREEIETVE